VSRAPRLRALIAEDESLARANLREYLASAEGVELVGEAADGREAVRLANELAPDLLFLDVRLPELSGIEVAKRLAHDPIVIFTTAYDRYALAAFELGALDYLLKPFGRARFLAAVERARKRLAERPSPAERASDSTAEPLVRVFARTGDRIVPVAVDGIRHVKAAGDYAELHTKDAVHLVHVSLADLAVRLDPRRFVRVHRSALVNLDCVRHIRRYDDRRLVVVLDDGVELVASRAASEELRKLAR
jgi:two-component system LytT family response regulator